jgi:uncharacterized protein YndB with AHSA1/START domain
MNQLAPLDAYGELIEPTTLKIQRLLPGPIERVWGYLTQSDLRRRWLASGEMQMKAGTSVELTWRNDELTDPPGERPEGFGAEHTMGAKILAAEPPRRLEQKVMTHVHGHVRLERARAPHRVEENARLCRTARA